ncbi:Heparin sulfate O-sulfotransferase [Strongyloides ratti]|uniref:Heparin sulfate O-sulfotransferase n=1 Tax=Strongyloides ratti TaxID=34506 RepID=A0A090MZH2_STRRB|nr:Heparin sulfate O-sulfotransferase [Strongyloides ratti]CEF68929.1 Heparin sulfate O-sulfotransferase [Strongyloides ratti]
MSQIEDDEKSRQIEISEIITKDSEQLIIYNRIPKTGSTTLTNAIGYDLCKVNNFHSIHLNMTKNRYMMNLIDQGTFIRNISKWKDKLPAFYHGHVAFIDFTKFGYTNPIYINMIREPLDRLLSHYYFLRYGDNYRIGLKRSKAGNNETFDDCIKRKGNDCDIKNIWLQIPYFCGSHSFCSEPGNNFALETAKKNFLNHYLIVGTTDKLEKLIKMLEHLVPKFFKGAYKHFKELPASKTHLRSTLKKIPPTEETINIVKENKIYQMEKNFYDFVAYEFDRTWEKIFTKDTFLQNQYHYEKIKP